MGRSSKLEENGPLASTFATAPDLELLLVLLGRQAQEWRNLGWTRGSSSAPEDELSAYENMSTRLQQVLEYVSELGRTSNSALYKSSVIQELEDLQEWAENDLAFNSAPVYKDNLYAQTLVRLIQTLLGILEEFI